jgi:hypothetical protein
MIMTTIAMIVRMRRKIVRMRIMSLNAVQTKTAVMSIKEIKEIKEILHLLKLKDLEEYPNLR